MKPYQHVLVPVDFSQISTSIVARANELAKFYQAKLTLLNVLEDVPLGAVAFGGTGELTMPPAMQQNQINQATEKLRKLEETYGLVDNAALEAVYTAGKPSAAILQFAKENGVDLIVVGNSGRRGVLGFMGSTAEATVKGASCDVMAVRISD
ncbi:MAG: universal stress protein [Thiothrix sp.]|jgi:universal stress protein A|uniref:universal stress protein n=1 Tax=Thiothrix sp. TaxID=1032 RepID=UPI002612CF14|nr:universal stress protein [Thiothrix sp.]MDD5393460.1 universal stress protein [Thiothrix sp.]